MTEAIAIQNQNILDIASQESGSPFAAIRIAQQNGLGLTEGFEAGTVLLNSDAPIDPEVAAYFKYNGIKPATEANDLPCIYQGIGYMEVEQDFEVGKECSGGIGGMRIGIDFKITQT